MTHSADRLVWHTAMDVWSEQDEQQFVDQIRPEQESIGLLFEQTAERCGCSCWCRYETVNRPVPELSQVTTWIQAHISMQFPDQAAMDSFLTLMKLDHDYDCDNAEDLDKQQEVSLCTNTDDTK